MKVNITEDLFKIQFHSLWKVKGLYKEVLEIELPEVTKKLINSVFVRHDIIHNNGKSKYDSKDFAVSIQLKVIIWILEKTIIP